MKIAMAWHVKAPIVKAWKSSWKPNHCGEKLGRLIA